MVKIVTALSSMQLLWSDINVALQKAFYQYFEYNHRLLSAREVATVLYSFGKMGCDGCEKNRNFRGLVVDVVEANIASFNAQELANTFWALGKLHLPYTDLSNTILGQLFEAFNNCKNDDISRHLSQILNGMVNMSIDWKWLSEPNQDHIARLIGMHFSSIDKLTFIIVVTDMDRIGIPTSRPK